MLPHTADERQFVEDYYLGQSPDATITFLQKVYSENVIGHRHDVWDVHASDGRWWVITNPTNLYSQAQFPNMDYAVTFHMGLCLRIPRTEQQLQSDFDIKPFAATLNQISQIGDALRQAQNINDYQSVGVRCREALLSFIAAAQDIAEWATQDAPKRADFRAWTEIICNEMLSGRDQKERRHLIKTLLVECWTYSNWLTHAKSSSWHDAEMAQSTVESTIGICVSTIIRYIRMVPDACPQCSSPHLSPEAGVRVDAPDALWERPVCEDCGWSGTPIIVRELDPEEIELITREGGENTGECIVPNVPLYKLDRPTENEA
ncbi:hypothetical protein [Xanthomonas euvesicatoria]|uniref:hypothetical protein n=1 Tax=Xanthomonas euvesicatoria TaxID=456327 RepID=UPI001C44E148|nr:hypothetical protein [Xanthomonas euvesicatoria]MBV6898266.1 hypothetical protein [Xanthomonas campestris pv. ionidii]MBZ2750982.1 hypothetical protein [Xanthomonas perforans]